MKEERKYSTIILSYITRFKLHEVAKHTILDRCKQNTYGPGLKEKGALVSTSQSVGTLRNT